MNTLTQAAPRTEARHRIAQDHAPVIVVHASAQDLVYSTDSNPEQYRESYGPIQPKVSPAPFQVREAEIELSPVQKNLFRQVFYGVQSLPSSIAEHLTSAERLTIEKKYDRGQQIIQGLKYQAYFGEVDKLFNTMTIQHCDGTVSRLQDSARMGNFRRNDGAQVPRRLSLSDLRITRRQVIDAFIRVRLLPADFYQLNPFTFQL